MARGKHVHLSLTRTCETYVVRVDGGVDVASACAESPCAGIMGCASVL